MVQSKILQKYKQISHCFLDADESGEFEKANIDVRNCIKLRQVHSNRIHIVENKSSKDFEADGMITQRKFSLCIKTADCLPILFFEKKKIIIGAVHVGWKGLHLGILNEAVAGICKLGGQTKNIIAVIGPHIGQCCYEISKKFITNFPNEIKRDSVIKSKNQRLYLDLGKIAFQNMIDLGIPKNNIDDISICTYCNIKYFSYRRNNLETGRMYNIITLL